MVGNIYRRSVLACCLGFVVLVGGLRAEITESDLKTWNEQYKKDNTDSVVESDLAAGKTAINADNQPKIELAARVRTAEAKFNNPAHEGETKRWFDRVAGIIDKGTEKGVENQFHQSFLNAFAPESAKIAFQILEKPIPDRKLQTGVSVARMMAKLAEYGQEDTLYVLLVLLDPSASVPGAREWYGGALPQIEKTLNEGAMYYAAKGVAGFYAWRNRQPNPPPIKNKELETAVLSALMRIVRNEDTGSTEKNPRPRVTDDAPLVRLDGFAMLRREGIRALGQSRYPTVKTEKDEILIALELGRVMHGAAVSPRPRMDERAEAAIALLSLDSALDKRYQPDYAMSKIGEFAVLFNEGHGKKSSTAMELEGIRIAEAMARRKQRKDVSDYEKKVADFGIAFLPSLGNAPLRNTAGDLRVFLEKERPNADSFYKDVDTSTLSGTAIPVRDNADR
jgi:hypothetical protein